MTWNYRVVKRVIDRGEIFPEDIRRETVYGIYEVYYDENDKPSSITIEPVVPFGETHEELVSCMKLFTRALNAPVLDYDKDFPIELLKLEEELNLLYDTTEED